MPKYVYIVDKCYKTPQGDIHSYEEPVEQFATKEEALADAKKYAFLLFDNELYSVERHIRYSDGTTEYDDYEEDITFITNKDGE